MYQNLHQISCGNIHGKPYQLKLNDMDYHVYWHIKFGANSGTQFVVPSIIPKIIMNLISSFKITTQPNHFIFNLYTICFKELQMKPTKFILILYIYELCNYIHQYRHTIISNIDQSMFLDWKHENQKLHLLDDKHVTVPVDKQKN